MMFCKKNYYIFATVFLMPLSVPQARAKQHLLTNNYEIALEHGSVDRKLQQHGNQLPVQKHKASSSVLPNYSGFAVDGRNTSRWGSDPSSSDQWIWVKLYVASNITSVELDWEFAYGEDYDIQTSNDGKDWTTVLELRNRTGGVEVLSMPPSTQAEYVRMRGIKKGTIYGFSLFGFRVYGSSPQTIEIPNDELELFRARASSAPVSDGIADNAIDGDKKTRWRSGFADDEYIIIETRNVHLLTTIVIYWGHEYGVAYDIEVSRDEREWNIVVQERFGSGGQDIISIPPDTVGKFIRIHGLERFTGLKGYAIREVVVKGNPQPEVASDLVPVNIVQANASSVEEDTTFVASNVFDGDLQTRWSSDRTDNENITIQFDGRYPVSILNLYWQSAYGRDYDIESSSDGTTFVTVVEMRGRDGGVEEIKFSPAEPAQFIRVAGLRRGTGWGYSLWEIEALGLPRTIDIPDETPSPSPDTSLTVSPIPEPAPSSSPTPGPAAIPTPFPTPSPTPQPTPFPTQAPTPVPIPNPTQPPTTSPTPIPTPIPTPFPTPFPTQRSTPVPTPPPNIFWRWIPLQEARASSEENPTDKFDANMAIDQDDSTRWASKRGGTGENEYLVAIVGAEILVFGVDILWDEAAFALDYDVEVSSDGSAYQTMARVRNGDGGLDEITPTHGTTRARYVRIHCLRAASDLFYSVYELRVRGVIFDADELPPILPISADASSVYNDDPNYGPERAIDYDRSTRWASRRRSNNEYLGVEFDGEYCVSAIDIYWEKAFASEFEIQTSIDGINFEVVASVIRRNDGVIPIDDGPRDNIQISRGGKARFLRIQGLVSATQYGLSIKEIGITAFFTSAAECYL